MTEPLPEFPYHPNAVGHGVVKQKSIICGVCGRARDWAYTGPFYAVRKPEHLCPWCVADGSAAEKYNGTFHDTSFDDSASTDSIRAVLTRTPGFSVWNPIPWPDHHGECCVFVGTVDDESYAPILKIESVRTEAERLARGISRDWTADDLLDRAWERPITIHLFQCLRCLTYRLALDSS